MSQIIVKNVNDIKSPIKPLVHNAIRKRYKMKYSSHLILQFNLSCIIWKGNNYLKSQIKSLI